MADIATETRETVASPQKKEVEKKVEDEVEEPKVAENGNEEKDLPKENGTNGSVKESEDTKASEITENGDSTDSTDATTKAVKRKSDAAGGDAPENAPEEVGASPEKKAKLEEKPVENGEAEAAVA